jgi:integrase
MRTSLTYYSAIARLSLDAALADAEGQLAPHRGLDDRTGPDAYTFTRSDMIAYRTYLKEAYRKATAERKLVVARCIPDELVIGEAIEKSPTYKVRGLKLDEETPHVVLTEQEGQALLDAIDGSALMGLRDYVVILLLLCTGMRRGEAAQLTISDITTDQGHYVAILQHSKGDRRVVKLPVDVWREIDGYVSVLCQYHAERLARCLAELDLEEEARQRAIRDLEQQHTMATTRRAGRWATRPSRCR